MKRTEVIEVVRVYCDVCGELCQGNYTTTTRDGVEYDACPAYDEEQEKTHVDLLREQLDAKSLKA